MRKKEREKGVRKKKLKIRREMFLKKIYHILMLCQKREGKIFFFNNLLSKNYFVGNQK